MNLEETNYLRSDIAIESLKNENKRVLDIVETLTPSVNRTLPKIAHPLWEPNEGFECEGIGGSEESSSSKYSMEPRRRNKKRECFHDVRAKIPEFEGNHNPKDFVKS